VNREKDGSRSGSLGQGEGAPARAVELKSADLGGRGVFW